MIQFSSFSPEELRRYQLRLIEMLSYFDEVCRKNGLTYYLTNGSCLGAVRHHGFIPWDDDLDVAMPRDDYEKLWDIWNAEYSDGRYFLCRTTPEQCIRFHIMQLRDASTTCIYDHSTDVDMCHGIKIDICPLDGCPERKLPLAIQSLSAQLFGLFAAQRVPNQASRAKQALARIALFLVPFRSVRTWIWQTAEKQIRKYPLDDSAAIRCLESAPCDKGIFGTPAYVEFEGADRPVPERYDEYLTSIYGDYMQFPPPEARHPETVVACFDLDRSYKEYEGVAYHPRTK